jgi:membrane protein DedA with SNARE-associated domain
LSGGGEPVFESLTPALITYRYWILVPLSLVEGPTVAFVTGTLASLGYFNPFVVYGVFIVKDFVVDGAYYYVGRFASQTSSVARLFTKARVTAAEIDHARLLWDRHGWRTMFVAKLSWGLSPAFLALAGLVAVPAAIFFRYAVGIAIVQYGVLLALGYYFGHAIGTVSQAIRLIGYIVTGAALVAIVYLRRGLRA